MADFHAYEITATISIAVAADAAGNPSPINTTGLPNAVRNAVIAALSAASPAVGVAAVVTSDATPVTLP